MLVPHVTELLITKDLSCSKIEASEVHAKSREFGMTLFSNVDDGEVDDINFYNIHATVRKVEMTDNEANAVGHCLFFLGEHSISALQPFKHCRKNVKVTGRVSTN